MSQMASNFLTRWKIQLHSGDTKQQLVSLCEIVKMLNSVTAPENRIKIFAILINSDILQFILNSIHSNNSGLQLTNKIILNLSENENFYKQYFVTIFKSYIRALIFLLHNNSGDTDSVLILEDVFNVLTVLIQRASFRNTSLLDQVVLSSLMSVDDIILKKPLRQLNLENLVLINHTLEVVNLNSLSPSTPTKVKEILTQVKLVEQKSTDIVFTTAKILFNVLQFQRSLEVKSQLMENQLVDFFMELMTSSLKTGINYYSFDIFLNIFYYFLTDDSLSEANKFVVMQNFFQRNGIRFLINLHQTFESKCQITKIKIKVILAEIVSLLLHQNNHQFPSIACRKLSYKIVLSSDFSNLQKSLLIHEMDPEAPKEDLLQLIILIQFVDAEYIQTYTEIEQFVNLVSILCVLDIKKVLVEPMMVDIVIKLFVENWRPLEPSNLKVDVVQSASNTILKLLSKNIELTPNLKTLKFIRSTSLEPEKKKKLIDLYLEVPNMDSSQLEQMTWNINDLLDKIFAKEVSEIAHNNISKILSFKILKNESYTKIVSEIRITLKDINQKNKLGLKAESNDIEEQKIRNLLSILINIRKIKYGQKFRDDAAQLVIDLMECKTRLSDEVYHHMMDIIFVILTKDSK